ncbi:bifunctional serine/threonine-protein kinase/formylglycine-generating enzyme family protein [Candidatus Uabimicrobium sp. HlEnr_7]|uniref:bifunctional serine/threonine-protein kinase/formylglycine-generating enzyme family protein n=1 Tax=Candidatus Uabimicrobium helgolandensis TaxID=3095367 RepID=UPI0035560189
MEKSGDDLEKTQCNLEDDGTQNSGDEVTQRQDFQNSNEQEGNATKSTPSKLEQDEQATESTKLNIPSMPEWENKESKETILNSSEELSIPSVLKLKNIDQKTIDVNFAEDCFKEKEECKPSEIVRSNQNSSTPDSDTIKSISNKRSLFEQAQKPANANKKTAVDNKSKEKSSGRDSWNQKVKSIGATLGKSTSGQDITIENLGIIPNEERYQVKKILGKGGMGVVMLARDNILQREVAMKLIKGNNITNATRYRFMREARISGLLEHPNIVTIYDISSLDDLYFTMRMISGVTLADIIDNLRKKTPESKEYTLIRRLEIIQNICYALEFSHSKKIIHRDLKPENIMVGEFGEVLVLDWGLAKKIGEEEGEGEEEEEKFSVDFIDETVDGSIIGTPRYMSPEQARGETKTMDESTDIYSLGAILYEFLVLSPPFNAKNLVKIVQLVINEPAEKKRYDYNKDPIPRELMAISLKAMAKEKHNRYFSIKELREDIRLFMEGHSVKAIRDNWFNKLEKMIARNANIAIVSFIFVAALLLAYSYSIGDTSSAVTSEQAIKMQRTYWIDEIIKQAAYSQKRWTTLREKRSQVLDTLRKDEEQNKSSVSELLSQATEINARIQECEQRITTLCKNILDFSPDNEKAKKILAQNYLNSAQKLFHERDYKDFSTIRDKLNKAVQLNSQLKDLTSKINNHGSIHIKNTPNAAITLFRIIKKDGFLLAKNLKNFVQNDTYKLEIGSYVLKTNQYSFPFNLETNAHLDIPIFRTEKAPKNMVFIPEGKFYVGAKLLMDDYQNQVSVKSFFIDSTEVTFRNYKQFFRALGTDKHIPRVMIANAWEVLWDKDLNLRFGLEEEAPVFGVNYYAAKDFCKWKSRVTGTRFDLPRVKEWEKAARGTDGRNFPWGNKKDSSLANLATNQQFGRVTKVKSFPYDQSIYGVHDMAGNVAEWTNTLLANGKYLVKGSHFNGTIDRAKTYVSHGVEPEHIGFIGFRCVCRTVKIKKQ